MESIVSELLKLGVSSEKAASIAEDIQRLDARSLLNELLMRGLWATVIDETQPTLLRRNGGAIERLLASGVDPHDLMDVVREVQVDTIYNVAQVIDSPTENFDLDEALDVEISVRLQNTDGAPAPIHELHSGLMEQDPCGRHGEPRSLELRQLQMLQQEIRDELEALLRNRKLSAAALLWNKHLGGDLKQSLAAVQSLCTSFR